MAKSKFFCVAVEGATATDGRTIERNWIVEMAAGYNRATYGARINMEHIRGYSPEAPFNAYGDVLAVEAREITIQLNGKDEKRLALFAEIEPTEALVKLTKARQKIYTSIEVTPDFAATGKAGLVGLAVTDSPASLGTDVLAFSVTADPVAATIKAGLDARKTAAGNLFSAAHETKIEFETDAQPSLKQQFGDFFRDLLKTEATPPVVVATPPAAPAGDGASAAAFTAVLEKFGDKIAERLDPLAAGLTALRGDFDALKGKLETTDADPTVRPHSAGTAGAWQNADF